MQNNQQINHDKEVIAKQLLLNALENYRLGDHLVVPILTQEELANQALDHGQLITARQNDFHNLFQQADIKEILFIEKLRADSSQKILFAAVELSSNVSKPEAVVVMKLKQHFFPSQPKLLLQDADVKPFIIQQLDAYLDEDKTQSLLLKCFTDEQVKMSNQLRSNKQHDCKATDDLDNCPQHKTLDAIDAITTKNSQIIKNILVENNIDFKLKIVEADKRFEGPVYPTNREFQFSCDNLLAFRNKLAEECKLPLLQAKEIRQNKIKKQVEEVKERMKENLQKVSERAEALKIIRDNIFKKDPLSHYEQLYVQQEKSRRWKTGLVIAVSVLSAGLLAIPAYLIWRNAKRNELIQKIEMPSEKYKAIKDQRHILWSLGKLENKPRKEIKESVPGKTIGYLDKAQAKRFHIIEARMQSHPILFKFFPKRDKRFVLLNDKDKNDLIKLREDSIKLSSKLKV